MNRRFDLTGKWKFRIDNIKPRIRETGDWLDAVVPGTVHTDLLNNKLIEEPFSDDNELKLFWICESDWIYKTTFNKPDGFTGGLPVFLVFEGIDTVTDIFLNGTILGKTGNMFIKYEFDISSLLMQKNNLLEVHFRSPVKYAKTLEAQHGVHSITHVPERVYIRKAQYSFGWDWGPSFPTMGLWRPVYLLQRNQVFIKNVHFTTKELKNSEAVAEVKIELNEKPPYDVRAVISLYDTTQKVETRFRLTEKINDLPLEIAHPKLWWPNGEGDQNLYNLRIILTDDKNTEIDSFEQKTGIRTVSLQLRDDNKNTFRFIINGKQIYARGVNWIPADSFIPRVDFNKYKTLLQFAANADMNIIRVWGGGFYENDIFYDLCDELGLLVWQDFMFACSTYPESDEFRKNVKEEVKQNVERLRNHPSVLIWCGNNENEWIWYQRKNKSYKEMPGYKIYNELIPSVLDETDSSRPYWQSSPFGFEEDPNSVLSGNRHQWDIWSRWIDYTKVTEDNSLFVTEFGFQGPANKKTFEKYLSPDNRYIQSRVFEFHNKQIEGPERIFRFLAAHLPVKTGWDEFIYLAQLNQGLALKTCIEHWRMNWPVTNGSIIWQINDCWPVTSWALIDSELTPKIAYYFVKNIFRQEILSFKKDDVDLKIIALNQKDNESSLKVNIDIFRDKTGELIFNDKTESSVPKMSKKEIYKLPNKEFQNDTTVIVTLTDDKGKALFRNFYADQVWKYKTLPATEMLIEVKDKKTISVKTDNPAFFVDLYHPEAEFSDRGFILLPGEEKELIAAGGEIKNKDQIGIFTLNNFSEGKKSTELTMNSR